MFKTIFAVCSAVMLSAPVAAGDWTVTGSNGGTGSGSSSCERSDSGSLLCSGSGTWVGAKGTVRNRTSSREISRDRITGSKTVSRNGRERSFSWQRSRRTK